MATEYATLPELKAFRRKSGDTDDGLYQPRLIAASRAIDRKTGRRFYLDETATARTFNPRGRTTPDGLLLVDDIGSAAGLVVEVGTGSSWTAVTNYEPSPDNALAQNEPITGLLRATPFWGYAPDRVRITAQWGWPTVPDDIKEATLLLANRLLLRKDSPEGVAASGEWGALRLSRWDPDVEALVSPFIQPGFAG
ncbi:phage gp6-like head-tail connector protein [Plantactinospora solaniradicis]|uniref:Phage gp6-like head-tail connector protein n=1 Tax=Plantactinospora solaniradicis TaxID=1723736 RepID=A0ABW1K879_9ACTN